MNCALSGVVGIGMIAAAYSTMTVSSKQHCKLRDALSPDLADKYE